MIEAELQGFLAGFTVEHLDSVTDLVTTPFSDKKRNPIRVFVRQRGSQFYLFNEKDKIFVRDRIGRFVRHEQKESLREVLRRFDVYHIDGEISTEATRENLPQRLCNLVHALILLDVMF
jgi:hypothetical protein